jgi:DNA-binding GntR family transcriptional regulator
MRRFFMLGMDLGDFAAEMRGEHEELVARLQAGAVGEARDCLERQLLASRDRILKALANGRFDLPLE